MNAVGMCFQIEMPAGMSENGVHSKLETKLQPRMTKLLKQK